MMFRAIITIILALTFNADPLDAQTFHGAIQGTANDSSGSAVPNAQVTVTGEQTNFARQAFTDMTRLVATVSESDPRLKVIVSNQAGFEDAVVTKAEKIAARIFRVSGILVEWRDVSDAGGMLHFVTAAPIRNLDLLVNLVRANSAVMGAHALGLAALEDGRMGYLIWVFRPNVEQAEHNHSGRYLARSDLRAVVLGYVITHEMVHQLLGTAQHSAQGIMKADWGPDDIELAYQGRLRFSGEDRKLREAVRARNARPYPLTLGAE